MQCDSIAGRKKIIPYDYYETPKWAVDELLKLEPFEGSILEPCCGGGAISRVLEDHGFKVTSSDIRMENGVYGQLGVDMLQINNFYNNVITNPPYNIAQKVIEKSLEITDKKVAMLLKLSFLESVTRYSMFKKTPFKSLYVFSKRVQMYPGGMYEQRKNGPIAFGWYIWEHGYVGKPTIDWIKP